MLIYLATAKALDAPYPPSGFRPQGEPFTLPPTRFSQSKTPYDLPQKQYGAPFQPLTEHATPSMPSKQYLPQNVNINNQETFDTKSRINQNTFSPEIVQSQREYTTPQRGYQAPNSPESDYGVPSVPSKQYLPQNFNIDTQKLRFNNREPTPKSVQYESPQTQYGAPNNKPQQEYGAPDTAVSKQNEPENFDIDNDNQRVTDINSRIVSRDKSVVMAGRENNANKQNQKEATSNQSLKLQDKQIKYSQQNTGLSKQTTENAVSGNNKETEMSVQEYNNSPPARKGTIKRRKLRRRPTPSSQVGKNFDFFLFH